MIVVISVQIENNQEKRNNQENVIANVVSK